MLASLEDSDEESSTNLHISNKTTQDYKISPSKSLPIRKPIFARGNVGSNESDSEEEVIVPRGRLAARMHAVESGVDNEDKETAKNARERVRKMLAQRAKKSPTPVPQSTSDARSSDNEGLRQTISQQSPRSRAGTPHSRPQSQQSSLGGLFVSPGSNRSRSPAPYAEESDEDLPTEPFKNSRFIQLVEKKRRERLAKEAELAREKAKKAAEQAQFQNSLSDEEHDSSDDDAGQRLTQQARPTRKASKKALEEMHRETQRMSRNMQLAHEARTKKKITKASLFAKFNYRPTNMSVKEFDEGVDSSSPPRTNAETHDTPPTSPMAAAQDLPKMIVGDAVENESTPVLEESLSKKAAQVSINSSPRVDKGKGMAVEDIPSSPPLPTITPKPQRPRFHISRDLIKAKASEDDSDSDLEIVSEPTSRQIKLNSIFERVPTQQTRESHSLHALRMLAHLGSPEKVKSSKNTKPSMSTNQLHMTLQQRARQQAAREREERLQSLRDRGIIVQTAEEREKEMAEVEDLIAKARREGEEIMKKEREAAKKHRRETQQTDVFDDESDDEEWNEEEEVIAEGSAGSGSEDGDEEDALHSGSDLDEADLEEDGMSVDAEESTSKAPARLFDNEASEDEADGEDSNTLDEAGMDLEDDQEADLPVVRSRRGIKVNVISDDEDDSMDEGPTLLKTDSPMPPRTDSPSVPPSVLRSATKTFIPGLPVAGPAGLGLTQIFAGTMDDSQMDDTESVSLQATPLKMSGNNPIAFLRQLPRPAQPVFSPADQVGSQQIVEDSQGAMSQVPASQPAGLETQGIRLDFSQSQIHGFDSMVRQDSLATQTSDIAMTQDMGFQDMSPIKGRFAEPPPSTVDTILATPNQASADRVQESPVARRKGKLQRRVQALAFSDDEADEAIDGTVPEEDDSEINASVFDVMRKASRNKAPAVDAFDKKNSKAKDMVNEQAEESEDEYAGLGGASDDESGGEDDALINEMIDDEGGKDVDERQIAAFYAYVNSLS
jgi:mediator of replication checkpoint protein 1